MVNVIKEINDIVDKLDELEIYESGLSQLLSESDERELDLLHYIENNKINVLWCYRYTKELKRVREKRREIKNGNKEVLLGHLKAINNIISDAIKLLGVEQNDIEKE